ncbi:DNA-processing protein DprA [Nocardioides sp.]|uniref:DNA-processing protein DprA n=1 Tax=Nocardioides sp. TaxID=35761 RepID=UPI003783D6EB
MSTDDRLARVALSCAIEPGEDRMLTLVGELGAGAVHERLRGEESLLPRFHGLDPERVLADANRVGLRFVVPGDEEWPPVLGDLTTAPALQRRGGVPVGLWVRGPVRLDQLGGSVAVVGSRSATTYGADVAAGIAADLAAAGRTTVSGGAFGIDQAAHRGAVAAGGPTVAVLACGADRVYPEAHRRMIEHLAAEGAVVSETPPGGAPMRIRFLARNRLIATLSSGTVVVEAAVRSGALNTANWAGRLNRHLMGVPGPVTSASSQGVHQLVRTGAATLVTSGEDVLEVVAAAGEHLVAEPRAPERRRDRLSHGQRQVLDAVPVASGATTDSIARIAGMGPRPVRDALGRLAELELVERDGPGWRLAAAARE